MKYDCEMIKDLIPLCLDKTASNASSRIVEEHLTECSDCYRFYQEVKKDAGISFQSSSDAADTSEYVSLAKRLRRTKWYWRACIGALLGFMLVLFLNYADGSRLAPLNAAYASKVVDNRAALMAAVPMGNHRILYIFDDDGLYRDVDVIYRFPYWKYNHTIPNRYIAKPDEGLQVITHKSYASSIDNSLYIVYAVVVNDERVAYIDLGKEGKMQRQNVESKVTVFYWDETGSWDGTDSWNGMIKNTELRGTAYASDGTLLYNLTQMSEINGQESLQWVPAE